MNYRTSAIEQVFSKVKNLVTTRSVELWEGRYLETNERALLLLSRQQISKESPEEEIFKKLRVQLPKIQHQKILEWGIDLSGYAFLIYDYFETASLQSHLPDSVQDRIVILKKCSEIIAKFNAADLFASDISINSFLITPDSKLFFLGFLDFRPGMQNRHDSLNIKEETFRFLPPEIKMGGRVTREGGVYSLGVLAYALLCGEETLYKSSGSSGNFLRAHPAPSEINIRLKPWIDNVLGHCLEMDPKKRLCSPEELIIQLDKGLKENSELSQVLWSSKELVVASKGAVERLKKDSSEVSSLGIKRERPDTRKKQVKDGVEFGKLFSFLNKKNQKQIFLFLIWGTTLFGSVALVVGLLVTFRVVNFTQEKLPQRFHEVSHIIEEFGLDYDLQSFLSTSDPFVVRLKALNKLSGKDIKLDAGIATYIGETHSRIPEEYLQSINTSLEHWLDHFKYKKTKLEIKEALARKLENSKTGNIGEMIQLFLSVIDSSAPDYLRVTKLRSIYQKDPELGLKLSALLSEESSIQLFGPVFREYIAAKGFVDVPHDASLRVLFMLLPETRSYLGEDIQQILKSTSSEDLKVLANTLLSNSVVADQEFFSAALEQFMNAVAIDRFAKIFVDLGQREAIFGNKREVSALYKLALGTASDRDVSIFIEWNNTDWERVMYATLITSQSTSLLTRAFDILSRRGPTSTGGKSLLKWLRDYKWDYRVKLARPYAILSLKESATEEEIVKSIDELMPYSNGALFSALVSTGDSLLIKEATDRLAPIVKVNDLIPLLTSPESTTREAGVRALAGRNDLEVLHAIVENYDRETDPKVAKVYNEVHWVTRDRQAPRALRQ